MKLINIRETVLKSWLDHTGRESSSDSKWDAYTNAHECNWQDKACDNGFAHISYFCSFGTFNSHITELLTDARFDDLEIDSCDPNDSEVIFRYYERILLVASQSLEDFEDMIGVIRKIKTSKDKRKALGESVDNAFSFINNINKHKKNHFHRCNHHIAVVFEDANPSFNSSEALSWGNNKTNYNTVYVPKLQTIIDCLLSCYDVINSEFCNSEKFDRFCREYEEVEGS